MLSAVKDKAGSAVSAVKDKVSGALSSFGKGKGKLPMEYNMQYFAERNPGNSKPLIPTNLQYFAREGGSDAVSWSNHGYKHFLNKNQSWKNIVKSSKSGLAKYFIEVSADGHRSASGTQFINRGIGKQWL